MRSKQQASAPPIRPGLRRCSICGCDVPGNDQAWQTHTAGIRHRRNLVSCKVFGEPGHAVVSTFEAAALEGSCQVSAQYQGKDVVLLAAAAATRATHPAASAAQVRKRSAGSTTCSNGHHDGGQQQEQQLLQRLQEQLRKQLALQVGVGHMYAQAVQRFSLQQLHTASAELKRRLEEAAGVVVANQHHSAATHPRNEQPHSPQQQQQQQAVQQPCAQEQQQQHPGSRLLLRLEQPAQIACLALGLPPALARLHLTVPLQTYGPAAAATSAAVAVFAASLGQQHVLQELQLAFHCADYTRILRQGGGGFSRLPELWRHCLIALRAAMQVNCGLSHLVLVAYPGQFAADDIAQLQTVMAAARQKLRAAVLMATQHRLGARSPLQLLPREVLRVLLDAAVPGAACELELDLPRGFGGMPGTEDEGRSSDDSSSDDSSSDDSSSDDSSSDDAESS